MRVPFFLILFTLTFAVFAQDYDFGKVSKEELQENYNPLDSAASATYLYKYRRTYFNYVKNQGFQLTTEVHDRIKIYNKEGFDYATKAIWLYKSKSGREKLNSLKAYTYNLVDDKIEDVKLKKDGIFETEKSIYYDETKFTMPDIKEGSIVEYQYEITSPFYTNIDEFEFQHDIPVKKIYAEFESPEYFNFKANTKGFLNVIPRIENKRGKITFTEKVRSTSKGFNGIGNSTSTSFETSEVEYTKQVNTYSLENVPALKEEPYVNNIDNYKSSVNYELSFVHFPNSQIDYYSTTWESVVKAIYESPDFGSELDKNGYFENEIDALIGSISDPLQRTSLIFDFVKSRVKWNGYYSKYTNDGVKKAYKDQVGNVAEINLMLTSMLRYAGLRAYPVLVSTRANGVPLFPTREGYNYVVSYVKIDDTEILLDATNKYSTPNVLPYRTLNWQGRVIAEQGGSQLIDLYPKEISNNSISMMVSLDESGTIEGGYRSLKTNHNALAYRESFNEADKDDFLEKLENKYGGLEISDFKVVNAMDISKPVMETYKFVKESQADVIGGKLYFSPMFFLKSNENPFKLETREFPVDFGYPSSINYKIIINLPDGYKVESLPAPGGFMLPDNLGLFKYNISGNDKMIQLSVESEIYQSIIAPQYYDVLKTYFKQLIEKQNEQIVLTKA
ncbi:DUF3857 domain-containing protein [Sabulilitoribacter multivorans]|uniref:DUF3857 domain-containing protein n=1 Tax=Flaviramulus multivorans TaxID=1304750 RepID=A0ABS9IE77_9FLAO|nr:DUF3857 domain-containing protein [Flaviramulus multivorans]MCF7559093.1 DUF3857 domain-containing protein [Flaviramulus multivorans]